MKTLPFIMILYLDVLSNYILVIHAIVPIHEIIDIIYDQWVKNQSTNFAPLIASLLNKFKHN